jgi:hypothetical protein
VRLRAIERQAGVDAAAGQAFIRALLRRLLAALCRYRDVTHRGEPQQPAAIAQRR